MYVSQYDCHTFGSMTAIHLSLRFISLVDEIQFMIISSRHICMRSITTNFYVVSVLIVCNTRVDLGFLVDGSGSVGRSNFKRVLYFIKQLVNSFRISPRYARVGMVVYNKRPSRVFSFNR